MSTNFIPFLITSYFFHFFSLLFKMESSSDSWVCCDLCSKWRLIPSDCVLPSSVGSSLKEKLPASCVETLEGGAAGANGESWTCSMGVCSVKEGRGVVTCGNWDCSSSEGAPLKVTFVDEEWRSSNERRMRMRMEEEKAAARSCAREAVDRTGIIESLKSREVQMKCLEGGRVSGEDFKDGLEFFKSRPFDRPIICTSKPRGLQVPQPQSFGFRDVVEMLGRDYKINALRSATQTEVKTTLGGELLSFLAQGEKTRFFTLFALFLSPDSGAVRSRALLAVIYFRHRFLTPPSFTLKKEYNSSLLSTSSKSSSENPSALNLISLEFSKTPLRKLVRSPDFVRLNDWIGTAWPKGRRDNVKSYPQVTHYCIASQPNSYTDFHADFGGSSVWYHVLKGSKTFYVVPPTAENLKSYESWMCDPGQGRVFFGDCCPGQARKLKVSQGETLFIPAGWIHAVYTPVVSLVFGGNFLTSHGIRRQIDINSIETRTKVAASFRFPHFQQINFYAGSNILRRLRCEQGEHDPSTSKVDEEGNELRPLTPHELDGVKLLVLCLRAWNCPNSPDKARGSVTEVSRDAARMANCRDVKDMIDELDCRCKGEKWVKRGGWQGWSVPAESSSSLPLPPSAPAATASSASAGGGPSTSLHPVVPKVPLHKEEPFYYKGENPNLSITLSKKKKPGRFSVPSSSLPSSSLPLPPPSSLSSSSSSSRVADKVQAKARSNSGVANPALSISLKLQHTASSKMDSDDEEYVDESQSRSSRVSSARKSSTASAKRKIGGGGGGGAPFINIKKVKLDKPANAQQRAKKVSKPKGGGRMALFKKISKF